MTDHTKSDEEWKKVLPPEEYHITVEKGTEPRFSGKYIDHHEKGVYACTRCGAELFSSDTKFDSGTGWPSFDAPMKKENVAAEKDRSLGMSRTEVLCGRCQAHLGHIFDDGPTKTGKRYCINSVALKFEPGEDS